MPASAVETPFRRPSTSLRVRARAARLRATRDLVRPRVDDEEQVAFADLLIVPDAQIDDVTAHLRCDAHEVGAHRRVVRLRSGLPLQQRDDDGDGGAGDDQTAEQPARDTPCSRIREPSWLLHRASS